MLEIDDLSREFGGLRAVSGLSFQVPRGEFCGIIGPNGAGKTTLLNLVTGYLRPSSGDIRFAGRSIAGLRPYRISRLGITDVAARLVADGLVASAAGLTLGYGWKLAMAVYLPGGINSTSFGNDGLFVYYVLNDFGAYLGWLGVVVAACAVAWLGLRSGLLSKWLAVVSLIPPLLVAVMGLGAGIAGFQGIVAPIWLIVAFAGLRFGKHRIMGTR